MTGREYEAMPDPMAPVTVITWDTKNTGFRITWAGLADPKHIVHIPATLQWWFNKFMFPSTTNRWQKPPGRTLRLITMLLHPDPVTKPRNPRNPRYC
jgi:hypothetical protein